MKFITRAVVLLLSLPTFVQAADNALMSFPEIAHDRLNVYFSSSQWTAYFSGYYHAMFTVPRDSVKIPSPETSSNVVTFGDRTFACVGNQIIESGAHDTTYSMPFPTEKALQSLAEACGKPVPAWQSYETTRIVFVYGNRLWFGLKLGEQSSNRFIGGIGWLDLTTGEMGRAYASALADMSCKWLGARNDTLFSLFATGPDIKRPATKIITYAIRVGTLSDISPYNAGIPGHKTLGLSFWGDTLLVATDEAVAIWKPHFLPWVWQTRAYACRSQKWLYLKTFPKDSAEKESEPFQFLPLPPNKPALAKAQVGSWIQLVAPKGIEGYVNEADWDHWQKRWVESDWACADTLCLVRVRVPTEGKFVETDFMNTPFTYLSTDSNGVKIGFTAGWARKDDLVPVLTQVTVTRNHRTAP